MRVMENQNMFERTAGLLLLACLANAESAGDRDYARIEKSQVARLLREARASHRTRALFCPRRRGFPLTANLVPLRVFPQNHGAALRRVRTAGSRTNYVQ